jgi:hypothetical protein
MSKERRQIEGHFPRLINGSYSVTSPMDVSYNCIAWAAGDDGHWWEPVQAGGYYWPPGIALEVTLAVYVRAFRRLGYRECESADLEEGYEKIAVFTDARGDPTHAARQLENGRWTSKLGGSYDIEHESLEDVGGQERDSYGEVAVVLRRERRAEGWPSPAGL